MENNEFKKLLVKTAFCCMTCDGDIDKDEVLFLKEYFNKQLPDDNNSINEINKLIDCINNDREKFLTDFIEDVKDSQLNEKESLQLIEIALKMIYADNIVKYTELKYFKMIRFNLNISDTIVLDKFPDKQYFTSTTDPDILMSLPEITQFLETDLKQEFFIDKITSQYLDALELPTFKQIS